MSVVSIPMQARTSAHTWVRIVSCAALTALGAHLAARLPLTPVPATWQVAAVLFSGLALGARAALTAQSLYLLAGLAGAPVFAFGNGGAAYLFNPYGTGGYLLSYPLAAWLVGFVAERSRSQSQAAPLAACAWGLGIIYGIGCLWLGVWRSLSFGQAVIQGAGWFLAWDALKALLAIGAARGVKCNVAFPLLKQCPPLGKSKPSQAVAFPESQGREGDDRNG